MLAPLPFSALPALCDDTPRVCPVCGAPHPHLLGHKDFGASCNDFFIDARTYPDYGVPVPYFQCGACRFAFTNSFDTWSNAQIKEHIYNAEYVKSDPPFAHTRPQANAGMLSQMFLRDVDTLEFLDYGAGLGLTAQALREKGFRAQAYDPFFDASEFPSGLFDVILAFEVIEHVRPSEQLAWLNTVAGLLDTKRSAQILVSTDIDDINALARWYIAPRNGHVSIHSAQSLQCLAQQAQLSCLSLSSSLHVLKRTR